MAGPLVTIPQNFVDEWNKINSIAERLKADNVEGQLGTAQRNLDNLKHSLDAEKQRLAQLEKQLKKEQKDVAKMDRPGLSKFKARVQGKLDEKTAKEVREAEEAGKAVQAQKTKLAGLQQQVQQSSQTVQYLSAQCDTLHNAGRDREALLERVFSGPLGDEQENRLERDVEVRKPGFKDWERRSVDDAKALDHMKNAVGFCAKSLQFLQEAMQAARMDMVGNIGRNGGFVDNMAAIRKRQALNGATQCLNKSSDYVERAREYIPDIRGIDPDLIKTMGGFVDIVFDNMFTDAVIAKQIKQSSERTGATYKHLQQGLQWVQGRVSENGTRFAEIKKDYLGKKAELLNYRTHLMTLAARGNSWNGFSGDKSQFGTIPTAVAPPPYAAYPGEVPEVPVDDLLKLNLDAAIPAGTEAASYTPPAYAPSAPPGAPSAYPPPGAPPAGYPGATAPMGYPPTEAATMGYSPASAPVASANCLFCKTSLAPEAKFCHNCGTPRAQ